jgi:hypothetical protein
LLGRYKKAASADAKKADAEGDYDRGNKRFKGINKATNKQFDNDLKKHNQQGVAESFDQRYSIDWEDNPNDDSWRRNPDYPTEVYAHATLVDGTPLHIFFVKLNIEDLRDNGDWDIEFSRNNNREVTGEGDEKRIFATVLVAIQQFVKKYKPNSITFSADTRPPPGPAGTRVNPQSRAKLYNTMVQRYASPAGYRFQRRQGHDKITYLLQRATSGVVEGQLNEFDHESR